MQIKDALFGEPEEEVGQSPAAAAEIREALKGILESHPFRTSRQCRGLLAYIVEHSLSGHEEDLRERILGVEVFGRSPDYDTGEDPVVRMRAADVRKRLAQFYQATEPQKLQIEIKPGSYRASFRWKTEPVRENRPHSLVTTLEPVPAIATFEAVEAPVVPVPLTAHPSFTRFRSSWLWVAASLLVLATAAGVAAKLWTGNADSAQKQFWEPVTRGKQPILLYLGANVAYRFTSDYMSRYQKQHGLADQNGPEFFPALPPGSAVRSEDLLPITNTFTSGKDAESAVQVALLLNHWSRAFTMRFADELSMSDLRNTPAIFIGGFNNRWTLETTKPLPLTLRDGISIVEQAPPGRRWTVNEKNLGTTKEDYALISRVWSATTGGPVISLAGVGSFGTQAAAEFVCNPDRMAELLRAAPARWDGKNLQAVLRIHVVDFQPVSTEIAATHFW